LIKYHASLNTIAGRGDSKLAIGKRQHFSV
jgi:hypothetical protein